MIYRVAEFITVSAAHMPDGTGLWDPSGKMGLVPLTMKGEFIDAQLTNYQYLSEEASKFGGTLAVEKVYDEDLGCVLHGTTYIPDLIEEDLNIVNTNCN